jgi:hypothetical protein
MGQSVAYNETSGGIAGLLDIEAADVVVVVVVGAAAMVVEVDGVDVVDGVEVDVDGAAAAIVEFSDVLFVVVDVVEHPPNPSNAKTTERLTTIAIHLENCFLNILYLLFLVRNVC